MTSVAELRARRALDPAACWRRFREGHGPRHHLTVLLAAEIHDERYGGGRWTRDSVSDTWLAVGSWRAAEHVVDLLEQVNGQGLVPLYLGRFGTGGQGRGRVPAMENPGNETNIENVEGDVEVGQPVSNEGGGGRRERAGRLAGAAAGSGGLGGVGRGRAGRDGAGLGVARPG